jgi:hypothetical protein
LDSISAFRRFELNLLLFGVKAIMKSVIEIKRQLFSPKIGEKAKGNVHNIDPMMNNILGYTFTRKPSVG